jgi:hypothetical protein
MPMAKGGLDWTVFVAQLTRGMSSTKLAGNSAVAGGVFAGLDGVAAAKSVDLRSPAPRREPAGVRPVWWS